MRKLRKNYNSLFIEAFSIKPVAFNPVLACMGGCATAGLFMSQLLFWWDKGRSHDWIYKTISEFKRETQLTRSEQTRAIQIWKSLNVLEVVLGGLPCRRNFRINLDVLDNLIRLHLKDCMLHKTANLSAETSNAVSDIRQAITESKPRDKKQERAFKKFNERKAELTRRSSFS